MSSAPGTARRRGHGCTCRSSRIFVNLGALEYRERHLRIVGIGESTLRLACPRTGARWIQLPMGRRLVLYREVGG